MGVIIKEPTTSPLPYKSLIFNWTSGTGATILYDDTNGNWNIVNTSLGVLYCAASSITFFQNEYCVIVTPIRQSNNHSINVNLYIPSSNFIQLTCTENQSNIETNDGFENCVIQINFFNI